MNKLKYTKNMVNNNTLHNIFCVLTLTLSLALTRNPPFFLMLLIKKEKGEVTRWINCFSHKASDKLVASQKVFIKIVLGSIFLVSIDLFCWGFEPSPNFQKGGGLTERQFLEGVAGKEEVTFFRGVAIFT